MMMMMMMSWLRSQPQHLNASLESRSVACVPVCSLWAVRHPTVQSEPCDWKSTIHMNGRSCANSRQGSATGLLCLRPRVCKKNLLLLPGLFFSLIVFVFRLPLVVQVQAHQNQRPPLVRSDRSPLLQHHVRTQSSCARVEVVMLPANVVQRERRSLQTDGRQAQ